jgi:hypothetical protein
MRYPTRESNFVSNLISNISVKTTLSQISYLKSHISMKTLTSLYAMVGI